MAILNNQGQPYKTSGQLQFYNPNDPQHALNNLYDRDAVRQGGSPLYYYEVFIPTGEIDKTYIESRGKLYSEHPVEIWGLYDPEASQNYMNAWGIDGMGDAIFECNRQDVLNRVGHMPKIGSRIHTPHLGENWKVVQRNLGEFKQWGALRLFIICQKFQETSTTSEGRVTANSPNVPGAIK